MEPSLGANDQGVYLYCFARPDTADNSVEIAHLAMKNVAAVIARIPLSEWVGAEAEARREDSRWLIPRALAHEEVVEAQMARSPVLPVRFGAVFSSEAALVQFMTDHFEEIAGFLDASVMERSGR